MMQIRQASKKDIDSMVELDRKCYGEYGEPKEFFIKRMNKFPEGVLILEDDKKITGFFVFEILEADEIPENFSDMDIIKPISGRWMHARAFTTAGKYHNKEQDSKLLDAAEKIAKERGCVESCVPLTLNHPHKEAFVFWKTNGYKKSGKIKWKIASNILECYFYRKKLR